MSSFIDTSPVEGQLDVIKLHSTVEMVHPRGGAAIIEVLFFFFPFSFVSK
jgi:gamma-glutamyl phosphate reductase